MPDGATAEIVAYSYVAPGAEKGRPMLFAFPGGPGASVADLAIGGLGPWIVEHDDASRPDAEAMLKANPVSPFSECDLVFVDMPEVGLSRIRGGSPTSFFGILPDAKLQARFVSRWIDEFDRRNSPIYLLGKSYGTIRAAYTAQELLTLSPKLNLAGMISVCGAWDLQAMDFEPPAVMRGNQTAFWSFLPSYAAIAWYHRRVTRRGDFADFVNAARRFALERYAPALLKGSRLGLEERLDLSAELSGLIGMPSSVVLERDNRIDPSFFCSHLLAGKQLSLDNAMFTNGDPDNPSGDAAWRALLAQAGIERPDAYRMDAFALGAEWDWSTSAEWKLGYPGASAPIASVMRARPQFRLFAACGYYDLEAGFALIENALAHPGIPASRVTLQHYHSGHTPWLVAEAGAKLNDDIRHWIATTAG